MNSVLGNAYIFFFYAIGNAVYLVMVKNVYLVMVKKDNLIYTLQSINTSKNLLRSISNLMEQIHEHIKNKTLSHEVDELKIDIAIRENFTRYY